MPGRLVALSGGMDSAVCLALAARDASRAAAHAEPLLALTFDYGQRHRGEIERAAILALHYRASHLVVALDASRWGGSALTDSAIEVPDPGRAGDAPGPAGPAGIPVTYVPARNTIFLAVALAVAEARDLDTIYIGVNAVDYSGYPDCRPEFIEAFRRVAQLGLRRGVEGRPVDICTPLIDKGKGEIVRIGIDLDVPLRTTWSCYRDGPSPCGRCDACRLRAKGFADACAIDPALEPR